MDAYEQSMASLGAKILFFYLIGKLFLWDFLFEESRRPPWGAPSGRPEIIS